MRTLLIHADYIEWEPMKRAIKAAEEVEGKKVRVEETLVVFTAVEKPDEKNVQEIISKAGKEILDVFGKVKAKNIVLYPYAHLSSNLSSPAVGLDVMKGLEGFLKEKEYSVWRAPFGWYKAFSMKVKGHPLSELSKEIVLEGSVKEIEHVDPVQLLKELSKIKIDRKDLKDNDHRILGQQMDLFSFSDTAPGMVFWHNNGLIIRNKLIEFWREEHAKAGYKEVLTPQILDKRLWQISGHWDKYKENIFLSEYEKRVFAMKPMNCPGGMLIYKTRPRSYKELPLRMGELGIVHRQELSGVLAGLFRVIQFTQDDAHIFCTEEQMEDEIVAIIEMVDRFYKLFGFEYHVELSTRPEKRIGNDSIWDKAEKTLEDVLKKRKMKYKLNPGDGAFYGPKIDFHIKDSQGRTWQLATIQLDFAMPERFDLDYIDKENNHKRPIILHRVVYGALERFIGILLEHFNGRLPLWLAPVQMRVVNFTERNTKACEKLAKELLDMGFRADMDLKEEPLQGKIRQAEVEKIPYIIVIGDREEKEGTLAVRKSGKVSPVKKALFIKQIEKEIKEKST